MITDNSQWEALTTPGYCWYDNDEAEYKGTYGGLYNSYTVQTGKLCTAGWHVSTDENWTTLTTYLGGESVAGSKLKETGTNHWFGPNTDATNSSGFAALPGGERVPSFGWFDVYGYYWSIPENDPGNFLCRIMYNSYSMVERNLTGGYVGISVRCVKD